MIVYNFRFPSKFSINVRIDEVPGGAVYVLIEKFIFFHNARK